MTDRNCTIQNTSTQDKKSRFYTTESFIAKANSVHGSKYTYSKTQYIKSTLKVIITCITHGDFNQEAASHIRGYGCPSCARIDVGRKNIMSFADFSSAATLVHGGKYTYNESTYLKQSSLVDIACKVHGYFKQKGNEHLKGKSCPKCAGLEKDTAEFIRQARLVHGGKYSYEKTKYTTYQDKLSIECPKHGEFVQNPRKHLDGNGCYECGKEMRCGFNRKTFERVCNEGHRKPVLYVIKCFDSLEKFYKVGITSKTIKERFYPSNLPYQYEVLFEVKADPLSIFDLERSLHKTLSKYSYEPKKIFKGYTECFNSIKPVSSLLKKITTSEQILLLT